MSNSENDAKFCYSYDSKYTDMLAVEVGRPYQGVPAPINIEDAATYIQPWNGYDPQCTLDNKEQCQCLPSQTFNIKLNNEYNNVEVESDEWMSLACEAAKEGLAGGGGPFGAVILQIDDESNEVIRYWKNHNHVTKWNDPTAHAEVTTIRAACQQLGVFDLSKINKKDSKLPQPGQTSHCIIYSSAEPCPMCYAAISWARMPQLIFAATRYDSAVQGVAFSDEEIYEEMAKPYSQRVMMKVYQSSTENSLDAFNLWKRSPKTPY